MPECLKEIDATVAACKDCELYRTRLNPVCWDGNAASDIMIIGEAPGVEEDDQGLPFVGKSGQLLDKLLHKAGLGRGRGWVFIANMLKCRPPGNRDPEPDELKACLRYLEQQIAIVNPKIIITLGRFSGCRLTLQFTAMSALARRTDLVHTLPSREEMDIPEYIEIPAEPIPVLAAYHPSYILRQGRSDRTKELMQDTLDKLRDARDLI